MVEMLEDRTAPATFTVTTLSDSGAGSLRTAISSANANAGADRIEFAVAGTINVLSQLPSLSDTTGGTTIDGTTGPGYSGTPVVALTGPGGNSVRGLRITSAVNEVRGIQIGSFYIGIEVLNAAATGNVIAGNFLGNNGTTARANNYGVWVESASGNIVGGTTAAVRNVVSGNTVGVFVNGAAATGNVIQGNYIGLNAAGTAALGNVTDGVILAAPGNTLGGTLAGAGNVISGNQRGVWLTGTAAHDNIIQGNLIGTNPAGSAAVKNTSSGVELLNGAANNLIGGSTPAARNVISGNGTSALAIGGATTSGNRVQGNYIGTNAAGAAALANGSSGIQIAGAANNLIGTNADGTDDTGERNVISGNTQGGITIFNASSTGNRIQGNYIGADANGTAAISNSAGIFIQDAPNNVIGGSTAGTGNLISGNRSDGISLTSSATGTVIAGNFIGTNATGAGALPNNTTSGSGITVNSTGNRIGTNGDGVDDANERNVIAGNRGGGIRLNNGNNVVAGNYIGVGADGTTALGNGIVNANDRDGIMIFGSNNRIGTNGDGLADTAERNVISANANNGITINSGNSNIIAGNFVGTNAAGTAAIGNRFDGIVAAGGSGNRIGTDGNGVGDLAERNIISGHSSGEGILVQNSSAIGTMVAGNYIGTDVTGTIALGNRQGGVIVRSGAINTRIGTDGNGIADAAERNVISGNLSSAIQAIAAGTVVAGNYIGTNATGTSALPNAGWGVVAALGARVGTDNNGIGDALERNIISGNQSGGVFLSEASGVNLSGNYIGTDVTGSSPIGNSSHGVTIDSSSSNTVSSNVIAFNGSIGVLVSRSGTQNRISQNSIFANGGLGIDLSTVFGPNGVTANDVGDADTGVNNQQNFPVISSASSTGGMITITGSLNSTANTTFTIEFFASTSADPSGFGEGERYLGAASVTTNASGNVSFTVTLAASAAPGDFITATANDPIGNTSEFSGNNTQVPPPNQPPVAANDSYSVNEDNTLSVAAPGLLANDSDPEGNPITAVLVSAPANGGLTLNANGSFTYTPGAHFNGIDTFTYRASDGSLSSATATVTITVNPVNDAPSFIKGADQTVTEDAGPQLVTGWATSIAVGPANEAGQTLQFLVSATNPTLFSALPAIAANGTLTYTTAADANGSATVTVRLMDNGGAANGGQDTSAAQTFTITATAVNDRPVARDDSATTNEDATVNINVLANDSPAPATATDEASQTLAIVAVTQPVHGVAVINNNGTPGNPSDDYIVYTPAANYNGPDGFSYTIRDSGAPPEEATASGAVLINPVNDRPVANSGAFTTPEDSAGLTIDLRPLVSDVETADADLTYTLLTNPASGALAATATNGVFTYTPAADFNGAVSFTFQVTDTGDPAGSGNGTLDSNIALATITVTPVNDAPVSANDSFSTAEDQVLSISAPGVLANDSDIDGDLLNAVIVSGPAHGSLSLNSDGSFVYAPAANYFGADSFTYKAHDGAADSNLATVAITISPVNDAPTALNDTAGVAEDTAITVNVLANDSDIEGDTLTVSAVTQGSHGAVVINGDGSLTYTPAANYFGSDTFTYTIADGNSGTATATVSMLVTSVNDPPVAVNDSAATTEDAAVTLNVLANDTDVDGDTLSVISLTQGSNGSAISNGDGTITYTPAANFNGNDSLTYTISDGNGGTATGTLTISVAAVNDPPAAADDYATTAEDTAITVTVLTNDSDLDGDTLTVTAVTQGSHGSVVISAGNTVTYTPAANFNGTDTFSYTIADGNGGTASAIVSITVNSVNDAPVAADDSYTTTQNTTLTVAAPGLLGNDSDLDGDALSTALVSAPAHGSLTLNADGSFTYAPAANFIGTDTFTYLAEDGQGGSSPATVTITVNPGTGVHLQDDPCAPGETALFVFGTAENDHIIVRPVGNSGAVEIVLNGTSQGSFTPTSRVVVFGKGGDDNIQTAGSVVLPTWLYGGEGNDRLKGGNGHDVLMGGAGDDLLVGGDGRDLLIGGFGVDRIVGNANDDILIAGVTDFDAQEAALCQIMAEWSRADASFQLRVDHLQTGGGLNGATLLTSDTVHDDASADVLTGSSGNDWFLFNADGDNGAQDKVTDMSTFEAMFADDIDFINANP